MRDIVSETKTELLNVKVNGGSAQELLRALELRVHTGSASCVTFVNVDVAIKAEKDALLRRIIDESDFSVVDGMPLVWIAKWFGKPVREKISGSDFIPALCGKAAREGWSVFLLGGRNGVPEQAAENLKKSYPDIRIVGTDSPPLGFEHDAAELARIKEKLKAAAPDILIVCMGCPKQEKFIWEHYREYGARVSICGGATVDFLAGRISRCPSWVSQIGMEWFYRFTREPKRLFKRYFIDDMHIIMLIWKYRRQSVRRVDGKA